jgi:CRISPR-associated protein (TIGR02710 family)
MYKVMLQTVGTGRRVYEAITKSIYEANPTFVYFFCSETSRGTLEDVLDEIDEENILDRDQHEVVPIPDINDHNDVFKQVIPVIEDEKSDGVGEKQFVIDYTSGTKAMSVGLALAGSAAVPGGSFRYVGSKIRDDEFGRVFSGEEDIKIRKSPTFYLGYEDERQIQFLFNHHAYHATVELIDDVLERNPSLDLQNRLEAFRPVCEWLDAWDHFDYASARNRAEELEPDNLTSFGLDGGLLEPRVQFLNQLCEQSFIPDDQQHAVPSHEIICDLHMNVRRRLELGHRMDAWTRLKRMHFMILQFMLMTKFGVDPVQPDPETIRNHLRGDTDDSSQTMRDEPLNRLTAARLLKALDPEVDSILVDVSLGDRDTRPLLGRGFHPAPEVDQIERQLDDLWEAFLDYSNKLETSSDLADLLTQASFPVIQD